MGGNHSPVCLLEQVWILTRVTIGFHRTAVTCEGRQKQKSQVYLNFSLKMATKATEAGDVVTSVRVQGEE